MKMNRNKGSLVAICQLDVKGFDGKPLTNIKIESASYADYSWVGHSPQDALVKRYPYLEDKIRAASFCRWTPYFLVR